MAWNMDLTRCSSVAWLDLSLIILALSIMVVMTDLLWGSGWWDVACRYLCVCVCGWIFSRWHTPGSCPGICWPGPPKSVIVDPNPFRFPWRTWCWGAWSSSGRGSPTSCEYVVNISTPALICSFSYPTWHKVKYIVFWDVMLHSLVYHYHCFGGMCCPNLQGRKVKLHTVASPQTFTAWDFRFSWQREWKSLSSQTWSHIVGDHYQQFRETSINDLVSHSSS
jgi:hypothetical protein